MKFTLKELSERQKWPLSQKIDHALGAIDQFYNSCNGKVGVSFSGGKDSTVLLYLVRMLFKDVPAIHAKTGLELPDITAFVRKTENVIYVNPLKPFHKILKEHGYPLLSKDISRSAERVMTGASASLVRGALLGDNGNNKIPDKYRIILHLGVKVSDKCCYYMKEEPLDRFYKENNMFPYIGTMASESKRRALAWANGGCNILTGFKKSKPLSIWKDKDIFAFIKKYKIPYSRAYDKGYNRTGCMYCGFGVHLEAQPNKFQMMKKNYPKCYRVCMEKFGYAEIFDKLGINY